MHVEGQRVEALSLLWLFHICMWKGREVRAATSLGFTMYACGRAESLGALSALAFPCMHVEGQRGARSVCLWTFHTYSTYGRVKVPQQSHSVKSDLTEVVMTENIVSLFLLH